MYDRNFMKLDGELWERRRWTKNVADILGGLIVVGGMALWYWLSQFV